MAMMASLPLALHPTGAKILCDAAPGS
jgi:hypothetical protein